MYALCFNCLQEMDDVRVFKNNSFVLFCFVLFVCFCFVVVVLLLFFVFCFVLGGERRRGLGGGAGREVFSSS